MLQNNLMSMNFILSLNFIISCTSHSCVQNSLFQLAALHTNVYICSYMWIVIWTHLCMSAYVRVYISRLKLT